MRVCSDCATAPGDAQQRQGQQPGRTGDVPAYSSRKPSPFSPPMDARGCPRYTGWFRIAASAICSSCADVDTPAWDQSAALSAPGDSRWISATMSTLLVCGCEVLQQHRQDRHFVGIRRDLRDRGGQLCALEGAELVEPVARLRAVPVQLEPEGVHRRQRGGRLVSGGVGHLVYEQALVGDRGDVETRGEVDGVTLAVQC